jgi:hypothetical protein
MNKNVELMGLNCFYECLSSFKDIDIDLCINANTISIDTSPFLGLR